MGESLTQRGGIGISMGRDGAEITQENLEAEPKSSSIASCIKSAT
jgi:hypothetical protein